MNRKMCLCTGMVYDPKEKNKSKWDFVKKSGLYERWLRFKNNKLLKLFAKSPIKALLSLF
jgi:hypothetical protein